MSVLDGVVSASQSMFVAFGATGLFALALLESIFFPIPPDLVLIALTLAAPENALVYAIIATIGSVGGAVIGYYLGLKGGRPLLLRMVSQRNVDRVEDYYDRYGVMAVGIAGFTPIPYKVFTLSSGAFKLDIRAFIAVSLLSRGARFFLEAVLLMVYGEAVVSFLSGPFGVLTLLLTAVAAISYVVWKQYF